MIANALRKYDETPRGEADVEFDKAIASGRLSSSPHSAVYAGHYMYMGKNTAGKALFKHHLMRTYIN